LPRVANFLTKCVIARQRINIPVHHRLCSTQTNKSDEKMGNGETHFGFQSVKEDEKEEKVYEVFENVASTYDLMNDVMSAGVHRLWKDHFMDRLGPSPGDRLIDVAGGTGDIAFRFLNYVENQKSDEDIWAPQVPDYLVESEFPSMSSSESSSDSENESSGAAQPSVTVCDINQAMLDVGKERATKNNTYSGVEWLQGNAECLPVPDNQYDAYTIAFGIRNCTHIDRVLSEAYRVLKPGGRFMCLEFSYVSNPVLRTLYDGYSFQVIPVMGQLVAGDWKSYQYLVESIRNFPKQDEFSALIEEAGFRAVTYENLQFGVAAIHSGFKL